MLRAVLRDIELGVPVTEVPPRPLVALRPEVAAVNAAAAASDYATLGETVPDLLGELHAPAEIEPTGEVRELLGHTLHAAFHLAKDLGTGGAHAHLAEVRRHRGAYRGRHVCRFVLRSPQCRGVAGCPGSGAG